MYCIRCNALLPKDSIFCNKCGRNQQEAPDSIPSMPPLPMKEQALNPQSMILIKLKSLTLAGVLEALIPGAGFLYAGTATGVLLGIFFFFGSIGGIYLIQQHYTDMRHVEWETYYYGPATYADYSNSQQFLQEMEVTLVIVFVGRVVTAPILTHKSNQSLMKKHGIYPMLK